MIDWTKPIETVSGRPARWLGDTRRRGGHGNVVALTDKDGYESLLYVNDKGATSIGCPPAVRNVPEKHERWMNCVGERVLDMGATRKQVDKYATKDRTACVRVEWQDGDGLT